MSQIINTQSILAYEQGLLAEVRYKEEIKESLILFSHDQGGGAVGVLWHPGTRVLDMDWTRPSRDVMEIAILDFITF